MRKRSFRYYDATLDEAILDDDSAEFEHFAKQRHYGEQPDRFAAGTDRRRNQKSHRRKPSDAAHRSER